MFPIYITMKTLSYFLILSMASNQRFVLSKKNNNFTEQPIDTNVENTDDGESYFQGMLYDEAICNFAYDALAHITRMSTLFTSAEDFVAVLDGDNTVITFEAVAYLEYSKKMLVIAFNRTQDHRMLSPAWLLYLYTYKVWKIGNGQRCSDASDEEAYRSALVEHNAIAMTFKSLLTESSCAMTDGQLNDAVAVEKAGEIARVARKRLDSAFAQNDDTQQLKGLEWFSFDRLTLTTVVENESTMTVLTDFLMGRENGQLKSFFEETVATILDPGTKFRDFVDSLYSAHDRFADMLSVIMLRVCSIHLSYSKTRLDTVQSRHQHNLQLLPLFQDFVELLDVEDNEYVKPFREYLQSPKGLEITDIDYRLSEINRLLPAADDGYGIDRENMTSTDLLRPSISTLKEIATFNEIEMNEKDVYDIAYARVFVGYIKKKLVGLNFRVVNSFKHALYFSPLYQTVYSDYCQ